MGEFFKGWRRKIGVMMLVMACVLTGLWLRSLSSYDRIYFPIGHRTHLITSYKGGLAWSSWEYVDAPEWGYRELPTPDHTTFVELIDGWSSPSFSSWNMRWRSVFYRQIVIPLTVLSACLLLSKPPIAQPNTDADNRIPVYTNKARTRLQQ